jgi:nitrile hydratase accessory protein
MPTRELMEVLDTEGPAAPPRPNGELLFEAPWEARLFGITMSLFEAGLFEWEEFRQLLIDEIQSREAAGHPETEWHYYERWAAAFERLLAGKSLCAAPELLERTSEFAARPHGHDH